MGVSGVLMIAGGGTGGHIYPAIAIAREYLARHAARRVVFVGTERGLEKQIVPKAGFPLELIDAGGIKGKGGLDLIRNVLKIPLAFVQSWRLIGRHRPNVVLGVGGYSSGPVLVAARLRGVPTLIHESNAFPGLANRAVARFATAVAVAFQEAGVRMKRNDAVVTGNPIRKEFFEVERRPLSAGGISTAEAAVAPRRGLLLFGGSQGSRILNDTMAGALLFLARLKDTLDIVHQTGPNDLEKVKAAYRQSAFPNARVVPYLDPIVDEIANADLVVSRSGAMTIGELSAIGRAAVLVPFAEATNNHQELNARVVERAGGAVVITQRELTPERMAAVISEILGDSQRLQRMAAASKTLAVPDATKNIVDLIDRIQRN